MASLKEIFGLKKKEPEFAEAESSHVMLDGIPYKVKGKIGRDVLMSQVREGVGGRPRGGFGGVQQGVMSEIQRRNIAVFGPILGRAATVGIKAPFQAAEFVGEKGIERFQAQRKASLAKEAFRRSPKFLEKQDFERTTKKKLERIGLGHISFEDYDKSKSEFDKQIKTHLPKPVVQEQAPEQKLVEKPSVEQQAPGFVGSNEPFTADRKADPFEATKR